MLRLDLAFDRETLALTRTLRILCIGEVWDEKHDWHEESENEHTQKRGVSIEVYLGRLTILVWASEELKKRLQRCQNHLLRVQANDSFKYRCVVTVVRETLPGVLVQIQSHIEALPRRSGLLDELNGVNMAFDPETKPVVACLTECRTYLLKLHEVLEMVVKNHEEWVGADTDWTHCYYMDSIDALKYLLTKRKES